MSAGEPITAAILCGGKASRMGGEKALAPLAGKPLLQHVVERIKPQAARVVLSVEAPRPEFDHLALEQVADAAPSHRGPLTGLYSALAALPGDAGSWLALCPCDAPFLPPDLVEKLAARAGEGAARVVVARYEGVVQPTFSLWHRSLAGTVGEAVLGEGRGGLMAMLDRLEHAVIDWPEASPPPFFNINSINDLAVARTLLDA